LGAANVTCPRNVGKCLSDGQAPSEEIQTMHPEAGELPEPTPGVGGGQHEGPVPLINRVGALGYLTGGKESHLGLWLRRKLDAAAG